MTARRDTGENNTVISSRAHGFLTRVWFSGLMSETLALLFVDDGEPEASDYATNFAVYHPAVPESYEAARAWIGLGPWRQSQIGRAHV